MRRKGIVTIKVFGGCLLMMSAILTVVSIITSRSVCQFIKHMDDKGWESDKDRLSKLGNDLGNYHDCGYDFENDF